MSIPIHGLDISHCCVSHDLTSWGLFFSIISSFSVWVGPRTCFLPIDYNTSDGLSLLWLHCYLGFHLVIRLTLVLPLTLKKPTTNCLQRGSHGEERQAAPESWAPPLADSLSRNSHFYSHKEMNSSNNLSEFSRFFSSQISRQECCPSSP